MNQIQSILQNKTINHILLAIALLLLITVLYLDQTHDAKIYFFGSIAKDFIFSLVKYFCIAFFISALVYLTTRNLELFELCLAKNVMPIILIAVLIQYFVY